MNFFRLNDFYQRVARNFFLNEKFSGGVGNGGVGGIVDEIGGNSYIGDNGDMFIAEACEYTNSFLDFYPNIAVVTNIEEDHLDFFKDLDDIRNSFKKFIELLPDDGCLIINNNIEDIVYRIRR